MSHEHDGHRDRLRNRFLNEGSFDNFEPHNILEMLLFHAIPRQDTNEIAHRLINEFGSLSGVFDAPFEELMKRGKLTKPTACLIKAVVPMTRAYYDDKYNRKQILYTTKDYANYLLDRYIGYSNEVLSIISMDNCGRVISYDIVSEGSINYVSADTRNIINILLRTGATSCVIAHNHPGNFAVPSTKDVMATRAIMVACAAIGVRMLDHIVIAANDCISMRDTEKYKNIFEESYEESYYENYEDIEG